MLDGLRPTASNKGNFICAPEKASIANYLFLFTMIHSEEDMNMGKTSYYVRQMTAFTDLQSL